MSPVPAAPVVSSPPTSPQGPYGGLRGSGGARGRNPGPEETSQSTRPAAPAKELRRPLFGRDSPANTSRDLAGVARPAEGAAGARTWRATQPG